MLVPPARDSMSPVMVADTHFDEACNLERKTRLTVTASRLETYRSWRSERQHHAFEIFVWSYATIRSMVSIDPLS